MHANDLEYSGQGVSTGGLERCASCCCMRMDLTSYPPCKARSDAPMLSSTAEDAHARAMKACCTADIRPAVPRCPRRRIECGVDKAAVLDALLLSAAAGRSAHHQGAVSDRGDPPAPLSVYAGDSMGDLAPLLSADLGIVVGQNRLLRRVASVAGITLRPLVAGAWLGLPAARCTLEVCRMCSPASCMCSCATSSEALQCPTSTVSQWC